jgi:hypothetical protein
MFNFFEKKAATKAFNFSEAYQFLKQEQKSAMFQAIATYKSAPAAERNSALWALDDVAKEVLREEKLSTDLETVQEFRNGFLNIPNQSNYTETSVTDSNAENDTGVETASQDESIDTESASRVMPRRFAPLQPVAPSTIIAPDIISAQQRGLEVSANPEQGQDNGEAALARLIEDARARSEEVDKNTVHVPHPGDEPYHPVQKNSPTSDPNIDWAPAGPESLKHPAPPEHLVK